MKTTTLSSIAKTGLLTAGIVLTFSTRAQVRTTVAISGVESRVSGVTHGQALNFFKWEMEKLNLFEVTDYRDFAADSLKPNAEMCTGKECMRTIGLHAKTNKVISANLTEFGSQIIISIRILDTEKGSIEKSMVQEYLHIPMEINSMIRLSVQKFFDQTYNEVEFRHLTEKETLPNETTNPEESQLNAGGPRMGFTVFTGRLASIMKNKKVDGGYDAYPVMFQFGYQFEVQYLNSGAFQALFEFIPTITGMDQGYFFPSFTFMNGLRNNRNGWEFAFGPTFNISRKAKGFYDANNTWQLESSFVPVLDSSMNSYSTNPYEIVTRTDSRGYATLSTGFILAVGKTFRSGKLNLPVNAYCIPNKNGWRFGVSVGYNVQRKTREKINPSAGMAGTGY
ncbi:MAG: hypothetical protein ACHQF2_05610 [Flavobacteriales bacterium]